MKTKFLSLSVVFILILLSYNSCTKDSLQFEETSAAFNKDEESPVGDDVETVVIGKDGEASFKTRKGYVYKQKVLSEISKRNRILQAIDNDSLNFPYTEVIKIPVFPKSPKESQNPLSRISSSEESPTPPAEWTYTMALHAPNYATVLVFPAEQYVGEYKVRCTVYNVSCIGNTVSWSAIYVWTKPGNLTWSYTDHQSYVRVLGM